MTFIVIGRARTTFQVYKKLTRFFTLGDPTFYRWRDIDQITDPKKYPTRKRGKSDGYLLGGAHFTYYNYLPYMLLRFLSATECEKFDKTIIDQYILTPLENGKGSLKEMERIFQNRAKNKNLHLLTEIDTDLTKIVKIPWFYDCNRNRYPSWDGKHDSRVV